MRCGDGARFVWHARHEPCAPAGEPASGRCRVDLRDSRNAAAELREMATRVHEDVRQRVAHFARGAEDVEVIAVGEDRTAAREDPVHGSRDARADRFHPAREIALARGFDDRVHVIVLDRIVHEPEAPPVAGRREAALELANQTDRPQRRQPAAHLQRDVAWEARRERTACTMRISRIRAALAASARASPTPARRVSEIEVELPTSSLHADQSDRRVCQIRSHRILICAMFKSGNRRERAYQWWSSRYVRMCGRARSASH